MSEVIGSLEKFSFPSDSVLDPGIAPMVELLRIHGIETFESCQGGQGHAFSEPIIRFHGDLWQGYKVVTILMQHGFSLVSLRRYWTILYGELVGPKWEVVLTVATGD